MDELFKKLNEIPGSYFGFVMGIMAYAKTDVRHIQLLIDFIDSGVELKPSDIVKFVMDQPDFHKYGCSKKEQLVI